MKKVSLLVMLIAVLSFVVVGCGSSPTASQGPGGSTAKGKVTKISYWTFVPLHVQFYKTMADEWNKAHPDEQIQLEANSYPYDDMHNKLLVALQSGVGAPDIADIEINKFPNFLKGDEKNIQLVPLNDIVEPVRDKMVQARLEIYSKNGKNYGLPTHVGASVTFYNKEYMDKAGVNPDKIETWSDYVEAGKKVVAATGKPMATVDVTGQWSFWPLISQQDSDYFDKNGNVILDNDKNIKTLQFLSDMVYKDKIAIPSPGGDNSKEEFWGFMNKGGAASITMPIWYMGRFTDYMPDLKGKMIIEPMPAWEKGGKRSAGMGGTGTAITKQSKNIEIAKKFLAYAKLSEDGNKKIWSILGFDPPRWDVWNSPELQADNKYTQYFGKDIFKTLLTLKDQINPVNVTPQLPQLSDLIKKQVMYNVIQKQSQTPEEALKAAAKEVRDSMK